LPKYFWGKFSHCKENPVHEVFKAAFLFFVDEFSPFGDPKKEVGKLIITRVIAKFR
jgi:hypothetical protein